jgi:CRP-like cAMP-binding protein
MSGVRTISPFDRFLYLKSVPGMEALTSEQVARLAAEASEVHFEAGQSIVEPGSVPNELHVIADGTVEMKRGKAGGSRYSAPETLGFIEMFAQDSVSHLVALTDVSTLKFTRTSMLEILEEDFDLLQNSIRSIARFQLSLLERVIGGTRRAPWKPLVEIRPGQTLDLLERLIMIRQGDLFTSVGLEAGVMLATSMKQVGWNAGETLWRPGERSGAMFLIVSGEVECRLEDDQTFHAGLGYPLGNIESLAHAPRWYTPAAQTDVVALRADHESFFDVMEDDFEVAEAFLTAMCRGILGAQQSLIEKGLTMPTPSYERTFD